MSRFRKLSHPICVSIILYGCRNIDCESCRVKLEKRLDGVFALFQSN
jgi:ferredoxin